MQHSWQDEKEGLLKHLSVILWITVGDIVLIGLRDFQDDKADVIMKYTADEARQLKAYGEIPDNGRNSCSGVIHSRY